MREFLIHKTTATHADPLKAVGLADLLQSAFDDPVEIRDAGGHFVVSLPEALGDGIQRIPHSPGYPLLRSGSGDETPKGVTTVDVSAEFARIKRWAENRKKSKMKKNADTELLQLIQEDAPIPRWWILAALTRSKLKGIDTWNRIAQAIVTVRQNDFREQIQASLRALSLGDLSSVEWPASSNGLFCPSQIKGVNELKPQSTSRGSVPVDAFEEWLRYRGYWQCANLVSSSDSIRVYVPVPGRVTSRSIGRIASGLEKERLGGCGPQSDILATLTIAQLLIERSREYHSPEAEPDPELSLPVGSTPAHILLGLYVTHYGKTSSQAYGVQAMCLLALPDWFPIKTNQDARDWLAILDEHRRIVSGLRDDRSDEIGLLMAYRRFLERRGESAIWSLVEFMEQYGPFLIRAREQKRRVKSFRTDHFRRISMGTAPKLTGVLNDVGFQAVATAVRKATVSAQAQKAMGRPDYREIRYDLLHDLRRKRSLPGIEPLIETVSDFISKYNAENARRREMSKSAPRNVTTEEFSAFAGLVERYGASTVGALLCAYGSCREPRDEDTPELADAGARAAESTQTTE